MQMTAEMQAAGAASHDEMGWHAIHWQAVNQEVRRLQVRIDKAQQQGKWGKVKALQHLLTHSFSGKALAVKRVTENQGKRTPGVDGEIWKTPQKKAEAIETLKQQGYHPRPLRRIYIPKSNVAQSGFHRKARSQADRRRDPTGWYLLTRVSQSRFRWVRSKTAGEIPKGEQRQSKSQGQSGEVCR